MVSMKKPDETALVKVLREGKEHEFSITLRPVSHLLPTDSRTGQSSSELNKFLYCVLAAATAGSSASVRPASKLLYICGICIRASHSALPS